MKVLSSTAETRALLDAARCDGATVGFAPTMGALHEGHASLMRAAARECDVAVASIFVNPLQFGADEDLDAYPASPEADRALAEAAGVDVLFWPPVEEMYPEPVATTVTVRGVSEPMEGRSRPTHFAGVATVVTTLLAIVGPCRAYFGEKDFQQLAVVRKMASDLHLPVEVVGCPIVRERDGLAMSSRNRYLSPEERAAAPVLYRGLQAGVSAVEAGERRARVVAGAMAAEIRSEPLAELDYAEVVRPDTLAPIEELERGGEVRLLVAARVGPARLIDNAGARVP